MPPPPTPPQQAAQVDHAQTVQPRLEQLVAYELVINLAFYLVVPFLGIHLREVLGFPGWAVGLVLGLRTFSQQGMFFLGGALSDRFGPRGLMMAGCLIRVAGFLLLGLATALPTAVIGAVLTGVGGALFSPSLETLAAKVGTHSESLGGRTRMRVFAILAVAAELGAVLGPFLGSLLLGFSFRTVSFVGAGVFVVVAVVVARTLEGPSAHRPTATPPVDTSPWPALRNKRFLIFIAAYSSYLLCYNQLYLALPVEIERSGGHSTDLAVLFGIASALTLVGQLPLTAVTARIGDTASLATGFLSMALAFASVGVVAGCPAASGWTHLLPATAMVVLLVVGQMLVVPTAKNLVPLFARSRPLGAYYGALASGGGLMVLLGSIVIGATLDLAREPGPTAWVPWALIAAFPLLSAAVLLLTRNLPPPRKDHS